MFMRNLLIIICLLSGKWSEADPKGPGLGRKVSDETVAKWNRDIFPGGQGLPEGSGNAKNGKIVYEYYCLPCHGVEGSGDSADELAGAMHSLTDDPPDKTIGTYWPYATTLFDFTRRSMPMNAPGILTDDEVYAVTAYMLYLNHIIQEDDEMNAATLPKVVMPNRNGFINQYEQKSASTKLKRQ